MIECRDRRIGAWLKRAAVGGAWTVLACGGLDEMPMEPELVTTPPPALVTGTVIAADSFVVPATTQNFTVNPFASAGTFPSSLPPMAQKLLVLSVIDQSRPGFVCRGGVFDTNCASIVVFEQQTSPSLRVRLRSGSASWFLHPTFQLEASPPPG